MANTKIIAAFLENMSPEMQTQFVKELNEFTSSESGSATNLTLDGLKGYSGIQKTDEEVENDKTRTWFEKGLKTMKDSSLEGLKASGFNIQEM